MYIAMQNSRLRQSLALTKGRQLLENIVNVELFPKEEQIERFCHTQPDFGHQDNNHILC